MMPLVFPSFRTILMQIDCPDDFSTIVCYAGLLRNKLSLPQARHIFMDGRHLSLRGSSYHEDSRNGRDVIDMGALRQQRSVMDVAQAHADLQRWDTGAKFYVPPSYYEGATIVPRRDLQYHPLKKEKPRELSDSRARIFGVVETAVKIEDLVDIDLVKALSDQDLTCSSEITHIENQLNNLSSEASKLKVKEAEVLREEERIRKMREDLNIQGQVEILSGFEEKGSGTVESGLGRNRILQAIGFGEGKEPSQEFDWLCNFL
ncbi:hypothetical protein Cgig2_009636 [Carnegiea gigantea]|uniref:Uncharacterized protein n=1 Tax=Carnegiea gigantea TaxID=171969 RepID=A0A9Q1JTG5_9CARY|nr:hypothetical protein Cgig2_009636 [Carnegiea gigantea]